MQTAVSTVLAGPDDPHPRAGRGMRLRRAAAAIRLDAAVRDLPQEQQGGRLGGWTGTPSTLSVPDQSGGGLRSVDRRKSPGEAVIQPSTKSS
jgi:hypothetical protein